MGGKAIKAVIIIGLIAIIAAAAFYLSAAREADRVLEEERHRVEKDSWPAVVKDLGPLDRNRRENWRILATGREIRGIEWFENRLWAATSGGLLSISPDGKTIVLYTRLNGLPDADVTCLAISENKLFAGTASGRLLAVKNGRLSGIEFTDKPIGAITSLLPVQGGVIVGTGESGVWRFDGREIYDVSSGRAGAGFKRITALALNGTYLVVGTFDDGVYIEGPTGFSHITAENGLAMNQVTALYNMGGEILAGMPLGWALIGRDGSVTPREGAFVRAFSAAPKNSGYRALIGTQNGVVSLSNDTEPVDTGVDLFVTAMKSSGGTVYAGTPDGVYRNEGSGWQPFYLPGTSEIAETHITSILQDGNELWLGFFEKGFDILDRDYAVKNRVNEQPAWAVNGFLRDKDTVWVAHNEGVSEYRGAVAVRHLSQKDGLIGKRVSAICAIPVGRAYATEAGITLDSGGFMRSLYAFHGLTNNHVYACAHIGKTVYAGTLGGLNAIEDMKVVKTFRPGESPLKAGWITALAVSNKNLFIGTYGEGVQKLDENGQWTDYSDSIGSFEVNPGAMLVSGDFLLVGSLDRGLFLLNMKTGKWENMKDGLASLNVTSMARDDRNYYIGSDRGLTIIPVGDISGER